MVNWLVGCCGDLASKRAYLVYVGSSYYEVGSVSRSRVDIHTPSPGPAAQVDRACLLYFRTYVVMSGTSCCENLWKILKQEAGLAGLTFQGLVGSMVSKIDKIDWP